MNSCHFLTNNIRNMVIEMIYLYNGEFKGFLTCIYNHYYNKKAEGIFSVNQYRERLFEVTEYIKENQEKADKVFKAIKTKLSNEVYKEIFTSFLSSEYYKDCLLLDYIVLAFKYGDKVNRLHGVDSVYKIQKLSRRVYGEMHRFLGILRFSDLGNYLYAKFEPDNDILILMGDHFADRLKEERFIIHDIKRKKAIISNYGEWIVTNLDNSNEIFLNDEEKLIQDLWIKYFETIAIESRKNEKLQKSFVPLKYRDNILEFNNNSREKS